MLGGLRFVFFSLMFSIIAAGVVFLLLSDEISNLFSRSPESSPTSPNNAESIEKPNTRAPEPTTIPDDGHFDSITETAEPTETKLPPDVKPVKNYLNKKTLEKYREIREDAGNLDSVLGKHILNMRNYQGFNPEYHLIKALDEKSLKNAIAFSLDDINIGKEQDKLKNVLLSSFNRNIVDKMLELLASSDKKLREIFSIMFFPNLAMLSLIGLLKIQTMKNGSAKDQYITQLRLFFRYFHIMQTKKHTRFYLRHIKNMKQQLTLIHQGQAKKIM